MRTRRQAVHAISAILGGRAGDLPTGTQAWLPIVAVANEHMLGPALAVALAHRAPDLDGDLRDYLAMLADLNRTRNATLRAQAIEAIAAFNAAGLRPMLLKGAIALFDELYDDVASRMIGDLDLLIPPADAPRAVEILTQLGYRIETAYDPVQHALGEFARDNDPGAIDLHVELLDQHYLLPAARVWARAIAVTQDGIEFFLPAPGDMVLHNLLHTQIHHGANFYRGVVELRQLYEFATLAKRHAGAIDWNDVTRHLAPHRLEILLQSYTLQAVRLFGLAWPFAARPRWRAHLHTARCRLELYWPRLQALAAPWANLRFAFAGHRMRDLYPQGRHLAATRLRHAGRFLSKSNAREFVWRLFRPQ
jgi:hypothetical protein